MVALAVCAVAFPWSGLLVGGGLHEIHKEIHGLLELRILIEDLFLLQEGVAFKVRSRFPLASRALQTLTRDFGIRALRRSHICTAETKEKGETKAGQQRAQVSRCDERLTPTLVRPLLRLFLNFFLSLLSSCHRS